MRRSAITALVALAVIALIAVEVLTSHSSGTSRPAPPLPKQVLQPPRLSLADLRGKPALVNFWASWCHPCREEAPGLERLSRTLHGTGRLVGVDYSDQQASARSFIRRFHWTFPVLADPNGKAGSRYGLIGLPTTVALDSRGRIVETLRGPQTVASLRQALRAAAAG